MIYICQGSANIPKYVQKSLLKSEHILSSLLLQAIMGSLLCDLAQKGAD